MPFQARSRAGICICCLGVYLCLPAGAAPRQTAAAQANPAAAPTTVAAAGADAAAGPDTASLYRFAARPAWVDAGATPLPVGTAGQSAARILLLDRQLNLAADADDLYQHAIVEVRSSAAAQLHSQIYFTVDPTFQGLAIHSLLIRRAGVLIDERYSARITAQSLSPDPRLQARDARRELTVTLNDLRAGDILDYAYTLHSRETRFAGHFAARLRADAQEDPVQRSRIRVRWPPGRNLRYRLGGGPGSPAPEVSAGATELRVQWRQVPVFAPEPDTPAGYDPRPQLQVSDFDDWAEVAQLLRPPFEAAARGGRPLQRVASRLRGGGSPQSLGLRALQYVQEHISSLAVPPARANSPAADADTVLERGFGDAADKAALLVALLRAVGLEAAPALADAAGGRLLPALLPTPYAFDHALVRLRVGTALYWLDPAAPPQSSPLSLQDPADFHYALVLDGSGALVPLPPAAADSRRKVVTVSFDLRGTDRRAAALEVTTLYSGRLADAMRRPLRQADPVQLQLAEQGFIARDYPGAQPAGPVELRDDPRSNSLSLTQRYTLGQPGAPESPAAAGFVFYAEALAPYAEPLDPASRRAPLAIEYPLQIEQRLIARLPPGWRAPTDVLQIENPAFRYRRQAQLQGGTLRLTQEYEALADHVDVSALPQFQTDRARMYADLGLRAGPPDVILRGWLQRRWPLAGGALLLLAALLWLRARRARYAAAA